MEPVDFVKVQGLGNDLILVDAIDRAGLAGLDWGELSRRWCDRHTGVGADGLLLLRRAEGADAWMSVFNADGSDGGMCGNGVRCVARYLVERRGAEASGVRVLTARGVLGVRCRREGGVFLATVDMGEPGLEARDVPARSGVARLIDARPPVDLGPDVAMTCVSMGNPHAVLFGDGVERLDAGTQGPRLERHEMFPRRVNVQFARVLGPGLAEVRTWERGAGLTRACGTGACATLVAGVLTGRLKSEATIRLPGGELGVRWDGPGSGVLMTGPAELVFAGRIDAGA